MRTRILAAGLALVAVVTGAPAAAAHPATAPRPAAGCGRQFDAAVQTYLRTTDERDARGFTALLHRDVTGVLPGGTVFSGHDELAAFIDRFFARTDWTQTFDLTRRNATCERGYVLFESVYAEPAAGYSQTLMIGVTWVREHGRWLVLADQNTEVTP
ncbi:nuclear transport factor 2 family protein [Actinophytocola sp.]|uniref:nuclear transport factor 2 family protein n=1 Tax=Actinophytocola sp. TaxID=1872138 RepID=UPI00389B018C